jgi:hypothetical protein
MGCLSAALQWKMGACMTPYGQKIVCLKKRASECRRGASNWVPETTLVVNNRCQNAAV